MGLIDQAIADTAAIAGNQNWFGVPIVLTTAEGAEYTITGLHSKHHLGMDETGTPVNTKNAHLSFHESQITDQGGSIRNAAGEVAIVGWTAAVKDSTGTSKEYVIRQTMPNETTGLIVCILGDYN